MERKKRGYKRMVDKKRDYRLFAIACEGSVRERDYFERFEVLSTRISVDLISDVDEYGNIVISSKSSPEHVLNRAQVYANNTNPVSGDQMWIARAKDLDPMLRIPPYKVTHVYRLMDQLQQYTSKQEIELFVNGCKK